MFSSSNYIRIGVFVTVVFTMTRGLILPAYPADSTDRSIHLPVIMRPYDFDGFWHSGLSRLAQWPMQTEVAGERISYRGMYGKLCLGVYHVPAGCQVSQAVIHIMDHGDIAQRTPRNDGFAHLSLYWYPPDGNQEWTADGLPDRARYALQEAIIDACQAVNVLLSRPETVCTKVGITGEGVGGLVAMAVAALERERVDFAVIDRPWPVCHYRRAGTGQPPLEVATALAALEARYPYWRGAIRVATTYFDFTSFATAVKAPVLLLKEDQSGQPEIPPRGPVPSADRPLPSPEVTVTVQKALPGTGQPVTWEQVWREWALEVKRQAAERKPTHDGPLPAAALGTSVAQLPVSTDKLFVTAEPVSLSW